MADKIYADLAFVKTFKGKEKSDYARSLKELDIIRYINRVAHDADQVGFTKTRDALRKAAVELKAFFML